MATYVIGDVQGCYDELQNLLEKIGPTTNDNLWFAGDLVNRGPKSLETLRFIKSLANSTIVLGNHDLHLIGLFYQVKPAKKHPTLLPVLNAPDCEELIGWLCAQKLVHHDKALNHTLVHAGIPLQWSITEALDHS